MATKAEIIRIADTNLEFLKDNSSRLIKEMQGLLMGTVAPRPGFLTEVGELARLCDLLLEPINVYAREHLEHMPTDTYMHLFHTLGEILEIQENLIDIIKKGSN